MSNKRITWFGVPVTEVWLESSGNTDTRLEVLEDAGCNKGLETFLNNVLDDKSLGTYEFRKNDNLDENVVAIKLRLQA